MPPKKVPAKKKNGAAVQLGKSRWKGTTPKQRSEAASKAARARWGKE